MSGMYEKQFVAFPLALFKSGELYDKWRLFDSIYLPFRPDISMMKLREKTDNDKIETKKIIKDRNDTVHVITRIDKTNATPLWCCDLKRGTHGDTFASKLRGMWQVAFYNGYLAYMLNQQLKGDISKIVFPGCCYYGDEFYFFQCQFTDEWLRSMSDKKKLLLLDKSQFPKVTIYSNPNGLGIKRRITDSQMNEQARFGGFDVLHNKDDLLNVLLLLRAFTIKLDQTGAFQSQIDLLDPILL